MKAKNSKTDGQEKSLPNKKSLPDLSIKHSPEGPLEKALKLGNDEIIARAISDMLKRDDLETDVTIN